MVLGVLGVTCPYLFHTCVSQSVGRMIRPPVEDPGVFLLQHLEKDLDQLTRTLGWGADDTVSAAHLVIRSLLEPGRPGKA